MYQIILIYLHILAGTAAVLLGIGAMAATKRKGLHTIIGNIYHYLFVIIALTASILAIIEWHRLWWFLPVAIFSYSFALLGFLSAKLKWENWLGLHLTGQGGSFIALTTAMFVVNFGAYGFFAWFLPTIIGTPIIIWVTREVKAGRRPKY